jgi:ABC-type multidrug transport system fused ATPase/permease subunit
MIIYDCLSPSSGGFFNKNMAEQIILSFDGVTFEYRDKKPILDAASFNVREEIK